MKGGAVRDRTFGRVFVSQGPGQAELAVFRGLRL